MQKLKQGDYLGIPMPNTLLWRETLDILNLPISYMPEGIQI